MKQGLTDQATQPVGGVVLADPLPVIDEWRISLVADETTNDSDKVIYTVPADTEAQVLWIWNELTTTATVGDRQLVIEIQDSANDVIGQFRAGTVQAASLTRHYQFAASMADLQAFRDTDYLMTPLPPGLILQEGDQVRVFDNNAVDAAADDLVCQMQLATRSI